VEYLIPSDKIISYFDEKNLITFAGFLLRFIENPVGQFLGHHIY